MNCLYLVSGRADPSLSGSLPGSSLSHGSVISVGLKIDNKVINWLAKNFFNSFKVPT